MVKNENELKMDKNKNGLEMHKKENGLKLDANKRVQIKVEEGLKLKRG